MFRAAADPMELRWLISSSSFFNVSTCATFETAFVCWFYSPEGQERLLRQIVDMGLGLVETGYEPGRSGEAG